MYRITLLVVCVLAGCGPEASQGNTGGSGGSLPDASPDAPNITLCGGYPTDTNTDWSNCGGCDQKCPAGFSCVQGSCTNDPGFSIGGISPGSVDRATVAGQVWVVLDMAGLHAAAPGTPEAPTVTFHVSFELRTVASELGPAVTVVVVSPDDCVNVTSGRSAIRSVSCHNTPTDPG